jgi:hypothetical protein
MPNWCQNYLTVSITNNSSIEDLDNFIKFNKSDEEECELDFNKIIPMPTEIKNTSSPNNNKDQKLIDKYGVDNWYDWSVKFWGTKWNVSDVFVNRDESYITYSFDTAWAPPIPWIMKVIEKYSNFDITLNYEEPAMDFGGKIEYIHGQLNLIEYELSEYIWENCDKDSVREVINNYISSENIILNSDIDDKIDEYVDDIVNELDSNGIVENAHCIGEYIKEFIMKILNEKVNENINTDDISKLEYDSNGVEIKDLSL